MVTCQRDRVGPGPRRARRNRAGSTISAISAIRLASQVCSGQGSDATANSDWPNGGGRRRSARRARGITLESYARSSGPADGVIPSSRMPTNQATVPGAFR